MREPIKAFLIKYIHLMDWACPVPEVRALEKDYADLERKLNLAKDGLSEIVEVAADDPYEAYRIAENILSELEK